jgi:Zn-dependent protease with chaperone function
MLRKILVSLIIFAGTLGFFAAGFYLLFSIARPASDEIFWYCLLFGLVLAISAIVSIEISRAFSRRRRREAGAGIFDVPYGSFDF